MDHMLKEDFALKGNSAHSSDNSTYPLDATSFSEYKAAVIMWKVCSPCLLLLGGFGNISTILVMRRMKDHNSSQYAILMALAVSDFLLLYITVSHDWVRHVFNIVVWNEHILACKLYRWLIYCFNTTSAWLVTCVTVQRTMAVLWPHRMRMMCTVRRTWIVIAVIILTSCSLYFHMVLGMTMTSDNRCGVGDGMYAYFFRYIFTWVDLCLSSLLPSLCLLICDVILSFRLFQATNASSIAVHATSNVTGVHSSDSRRKKTSRTTVMILTLSCTFVFLTMPTYGFYVFWYADETGHMMQPPKVLARYKLVQTVTLQMWLTNSAINFLLYCLTGNKYRREFLSLFLCGTQSATTVGETSVGFSSVERIKQSESTQLSTLVSFSGKR